MISYSVFQRHVRGSDPRPLTTRAAAGRYALNAFAVPLYNARQAVQVPQRTYVIVQNGSAHDKRRKPFRDPLTTPSQALGR